MKKLMIAAAAAVAVGSAFADPLVYDYKASVKHMYEKEAKSGTIDVYVKYVKTSKLQGYFIQDVDGDTVLANTALAGALQSEKKGFLVLINKSAEKDYRAPKIMPAQIDVKAVVTKSTTKGSVTTTKSSVEAYFYAGPFAAIPDTVTPWDASYDASTEWLFNNGAGAPGAGNPRAYGTMGSTLYLFGQHNTYNKYNNDAAAVPPYEPAGFRAFGDAWLNGAGFGTAGGKSTLCCGWGAGSGSFGSISGNLKGGLFLCSISDRAISTPLLGGYFTLGLEDVYMDDVGKTLARVVQGDDPTTAEDADLKAWSDGELVLSTTDIVTGSWSLKPTSKFNPEALTSAEETMIDTTWGITTRPAFQNVLEFVKGANKKLDKSYNLLSNIEPALLNGKQSRGLISQNFMTLFFGA